MASPPCETFSRVRHRHPGPKPLRSSSYPRGFPWLSQQHSLQVEHYFVDQTVTACQLAWQYFLEHPEDLGVTPDKEIPASIWQWPSVRELQVSTRAITFAIFQCSFEAATSKPTRFLTNLQALVLQPPHFATWPKFDSEHRYVGPLPPSCPHGKHHPLSGRTGRVWATSYSAAYPPLLCEWIAHAVLASAPQGGNKSASHSLESSGKPGAGTGPVFTSNRCRHRSGFTIVQGSPFAGIIRQARCRHRSGFTIARCRHRSGFTIIQGSPFTSIIRPSSVRRR